MCYKNHIISAVFFTVLHFQDSSWRSHGPQWTRGLTHSLLSPEEPQAPMVLNVGDVSQPNVEQVRINTVCREKVPACFHNPAGPSGVALRMHVGSRQTQSHNPLALGGDKFPRTASGNEPRAPQGCTIRPGKSAKGGNPWAENWYLQAEGLDVTCTPSRFSLQPLNVFSSHPMNTGTFKALLLVKYNRELKLEGISINH